MRLVEVCVSECKHNDRKTIDQPFISGLDLFITHGLSAGPQVNFDKRRADFVESRRPVRNSEYELSLFLGMMIQALKESPEFSRTCAIKQ